MWDFDLHLGSHNLIKKINGLMSGFMFLFFPLLGTCKTSPLSWNAKEQLGHSATWSMEEKKKSY